MIVQFHSCFQIHRTNIRICIHHYFLQRITKEHLQVINQYLRSKNRPTFESIEAVKVFHKSKPDYPDEISPDVIELIYQIDKENKITENEDSNDGKDSK